MTLFSKLKLKAGSKSSKKSLKVPSKLPSGSLLGTNSSASKTDVTATSSSSSTLKKKAEVDAMLSDGIKGNHAAYMRDNAGKYADDTPATTTPAPSVAVGEPNPATPRKQAFNQAGAKLDQMAARVSRRGAGTSTPSSEPIPMPKNPVSGTPTTPITANPPSAGKPQPIDQVNPGRKPIFRSNATNPPEIQGTTAGGTGRMSVYNNMDIKPRRSRQ